MKNGVIMFCKLSIFLLFIFTLSNAQVKNVDYNSATNVAEKWINIKNSSAKKGILQISKIDSISFNSEFLAYYVELSPTGYLIIPKYEAIVPIMFASEESSINFHENSDATNFFIEFIRQKNLDVETNKIKKEAKENNESKFNFFNSSKRKLDNQPLNLLTDTQVGPFIQTHFHQNSPYNNLCPMLSCGRAIVGCAATAFSQIMFYWHYPLNGNEDKTYYFNGANDCHNEGAGYITAHLTDPFDWSGSDEGLAELCFEVGNLFNMDYGYTGSFANCNSYQWPIDLAQYYNYANGADWEIISNYENDDAWFLMLQTELNYNRPLQYDFYPPGHAAVCDGWRTVSGIKQIHINYGWGGIADGWYSLDYHSNEGVIRYIILEKLLLQVQVI